MPNTPFTKEKVKNLDKGFHLTREVTSFDKQTGQFTTYPNRRERRNRTFRPLKGLNIDFIQRVPVYKYILNTFKKDKLIQKEVTKKEFDKSTLGGTAELIGYKSIIHYKN